MSRSASRTNASVPRAFTLVELLCSTAIMVIVLLLMTSVLQHALQTWRSGTQQSHSFQEANRAFLAMSHNIANATLNTYWASFDSSWQLVTSTNKPAYYGRMSELHFVAGPATTLLTNSPSVAPTTLEGSAVFFQMPAGYSQSASYSELQDSLNVCGYFLQYTNDTGEMPTFAQPLVQTKRRFRLMELLQPTEGLSTYANTTNASYYDWFSQSGAITNARPIAQNIILVAIRWITSVRL